MFSHKSSQMHCFGSCKYVDQNYTTLICCVYSWLKAQKVDQRCVVLHLISCLGCWALHNDPQLMDVKPALENWPAGSRVVLIDAMEAFFHGSDTSSGVVGGGLVCSPNSSTSLAAVATSRPRARREREQCESVPLLPVVNSSLSCQPPWIPSPTQ